MSGTLIPAQADGTTLRGKPLLLARIGWIVVTLATVGLDLYAIPTLYQQAATACPDQGPCGDVQFTVSQMAQLHAQGISTGMFATFNVLLETAPVLIFASLAALLFWRRSNDRMALFGAYMLVTFGGAAFNGAMQALPDMNSAWFLPVMTLGIIGQVSFITFFLLFPDGHFVPRWTRWVAVLWALAWLTRYFPGSAIGMIADTLLTGPLFVVLLLILVCAQVYRYWRVSNTRQRQQTKWVVYGVAVGLGVFAALIALGNTVLGEAEKANPIGELVFSFGTYALITLIPVTISIAILRSRLYDIDIVVRRTLVYGSLTAILVAIYAVGVVGAQALVSGISGRVREQPPLAIVATTLLIAALFQPLRRRLQQAIDQRFYRSKYDAERTVSRFGTALRTEVELAHLQDHLLAAVEETMHPAQASLWLRQPPRTSDDERKNRP